MTQQNNPSAQRTIAITVIVMDSDEELNGPATVVLVQVLVLDEPVTADGKEFSRVVAISGGLRGPSVRCYPLYCSPVLFRPLEEVVEGLLGMLVETGRISPDAYVVASPAVRITTTSAVEIVRAFRKTADELLREHEIALLEAIWDIS